eukprot:GFUD01030610.1.p1 GENE.GFUD01030610.1~~GFUD01030610.1.p1  ORF type:complete len:244 (+),score=74.62 GFUD01030610.1:81-812(+)
MDIPQLQSNDFQDNFVFFLQRFEKGRAQGNNEDQTVDDNENENVLDKTSNSPGGKQCEMIDANIEMEEIQNVEDKESLENVSAADAELEENLCYKERPSPRTKKNKISETIDVNVKKEEIQSSDKIDIKFEDGESLASEENGDKVSKLNRSRAVDVSIDSDIDTQIESLVVKSTDSEGKSGWQCTECKKYSKTKANMKKHVEIHLKGLSFPCKYCDKICKTRNSLNLHMYTSKACKSKKISGE